MSGAGDEGRGAGEEFFSEVSRYREAVRLVNG